MVNNWKIYWYYADIVLSLSQIEEKSSKENGCEFEKVSLSDEAAEKTFSLYQKAFRNLYQQPNWELAFESCNEIVSTTNDLLNSERVYFPPSFIPYNNSHIYLFFFNEKKKDASNTEVV